MKEVKSIWMTNIIYAKNAFFACESITSVVVPSSVTIIESNSFSNCHALKNVTFVLPSSLWKIDCSSFFLCRSLLHIEILSSVDISSCQLSLYAHRYKKLLLNQDLFWIRLVRNVSICVSHWKKYQFLLLSNQSVKNFRYWR